MRLIALTLHLPLCLVLGAGEAAADVPSLLDPQAAAAPVAERMEEVREIHGDRFADPYAWLRDEESPEVIGYLEAENAYAEAVMAPVQALQETLYQEMIARLVESKETLPARWGDHWYNWHVGEDENYWSPLWRAGSPDAPPEVLIDVNALAASHDYYELLGFDVTRDGRRLAYLEDTSGGLYYALRLVDLETGEPLGPPIDDVDGFAWAPDGDAIYYVAVDEAARGYEVRRHAPGSGAPDQVVYTEEDPEFSVAVARSIDRRLMLIQSYSSDTSEIRLVDPYDPDAAPVVLLPREPGVYYGGTVANGQALLRINDTSPNYRIAVGTLAEIAAATDSTELASLVPPRPDVAVMGGDVYARHIVVWGRRDGQTIMEIYDRATGSAREIAFEEQAYSAYGYWNDELDADTYTYVYESPVTPYSVYGLDLATGESTLLERDPMPAGFDPANYEVSRIDVPAEDGTEIPVFVARRSDTPLDGSAPLLLEVYGAYGATYDPYFDVTLPSLLDRGVIHAFAHVRGGGIYGDDWYDAGRLANKMNTFTDTIDVAEHLVAEGYTASDRMALTGASAGGLTVGAVLNMRPDLFAAAVLEVPFVDVLTAMLDPSLPLTTIEYTEWGNPENPEQYAWMRAYDPYPNLAAQDYPDMLVLAGLTDDQVPYWQPAKYVAQLRTLLGPSDLVLLMTDMDSGHGGDSGRYGYYERAAAKWAFILATLGIGE